MLVVISDLHLTDGTTGSTVGASAFRDFTDRLREMAYDASWRDAADRQNEKTYRPIEQFDLLLLGDILDVIRSTRWTDDGCNIRPWHDDSILNWEAQMAAKVSEIVDAILTYNKKALATLKKLSTSPIKIPSACNGLPDHRAKFCDVNVRIFYMVGNHDWFFVRKGAAWDAIRAKLVDAIGLAQPPDQPFPWDPVREPRGALRKTLLQHNLLARHGDLYDEFNFDLDVGHRDAASLGDALVIEVLNRFPVEVERALRSRPNYEPSFVENLKEIANVRPMNSLPAWLNSQLERYKAAGMQKAMRREVQAVWNSLVENFLDSSYIRNQDTFRPNQPVDKLQILLRASRFVSVGRAEGLIEIGETVSKFVTSAIDSYAHAAAQEPWLKDGRAHYVVYGHTHDQRVVPLDRRTSATSDEKLLYFNCGTWKRLHEQTLFSGAGAQFVDYIVMSYIAFFKEDERSGRPFEMWTGTLANRNDNFVNRG